MFQSMHACMHACVYVCMCVCVRARFSIHWLYSATIHSQKIYMCTYACIYVCMYVSRHMYVDCKFGERYVSFNVLFFAMHVPSLVLTTAYMHVYIYIYSAQ